MKEEFRAEILSTGKIIYEGEEKAAVCVKNYKTL